MAVLGRLSRQTPEITEISSSTENSNGRKVLGQRSVHDLRNSAPQAVVTVTSQGWGNQTSRHNTPFNARSATSNAETFAKQQSRLASLFIALLAVSPMAIEYEAADHPTMEAAQGAAMSTIQPTASKKAHTWPGSGIRKSEIRKTRWKRLKYEIGLKMRITGRDKAKDWWEWTQMEDMELEDLRA